jgi:hypothetical protein
MPNEVLHFSTSWTAGQASKLHAWQQLAMRCHLKQPGKTVIGGATLDSPGCVHASLVRELAYNIRQSNLGWLQLYSNSNNNFIDAATLTNN